VARLYLRVAKTVDMLRALGGAACQLRPRRVPIEPPFWLALLARDCL